MKVIFLKDLAGQGKKGELKEVAEGFGNNFLVAKGFAAVATPQIIAKIQKEKKDAEEKLNRDFQKAVSQKADLEKRVFILKVKVGDKGQVFGGMHEKDIAKAVSDKMGFEIDRHMVAIPQPFKTLGEHKAKVKLNDKVQAIINIKLEAETA